MKHPQKTFLIKTTVYQWMDLNYKGAGTQRHLPRLLQQHVQACLFLAVSVPVVFVTAAPTVIPPRIAQTNNSNKTKEFFLFFIQPVHNEDL